MNIKEPLGPGMAPHKTPAAIRAGNISLANAVQRDEDGKKKQHSKNQQEEQKKHSDEEATPASYSATGQRLDVVV